MKDCNPFTGIGQFLFACIITALAVIMLAGQLYIAKRWCDYMWLMLVFIALSVYGCRVSWQEYKEGK